MRIPIFTRVVGIVSAAIAIGIGLVVLFGYFLNTPLLLNLRLIFLQWAVAVAAVALVVGVINLFSVHAIKANAGGENAIYSLVLILSLLVTFILGTIFGPNDPWPRWIFENIQVPVETSLMAVLAVSLAFASARLFHRRATLFSVVFILTALLVLLGTGSFPWGELPLVGDLARPWLSQVPAVAGARGILLGIALGTIATGLRILVGADRPYGG